MVPSHLLWLVHALPAVALTITAIPTPAPLPIASCSSEDLIQEGSFSGVDLNDGVWEVIGSEPGTVVDDYLSVFDLKHQRLY